MYVSLSNIKFELFFESKYLSAVIPATISRGRHSARIGPPAQLGAGLRFTKTQQTHNKIVLEPLLEIEIK